MSDDRLSLIQRLLLLRAKIYDSEGESEDYRLITSTVAALRQESTEGTQYGVVSS